MSCATVEGAIKLVNNSRQLCSRGNIRLHKFVCNNVEVMNTIPQSERAESIVPVNIYEDTPIGRVLGIEWDVQSDHFQFRLTLDKAPITRRGMLSTVASIYDPLGQTWGQFHFVNSNSNSNSTQFHLVNSNSNSPSNLSIPIPIPIQNRSIPIQFRLYISL